MRILSRWAVAVSAAAICLVGTLGSQAVAADPPIKMTIGTGVDPAFSQFYVAKADGIFGRNGLDVDIQTGSSGSAMIPLLIGNQIQAAYGSDVAGVIDHNVDKDIVAVADGTKLVRWLSVVGENIDSLDGLKGKRIGITKGTSGEIFWQALVKKFNLNPTNYAIVYNEAPEEIAALERHDIDAFVGWEPWPTRAITSVKGARIVIDAAGILNNRNYVFMNRKWIGANEDAAERFMRSMVEATDFIKANPKEAAPMVAKFLQMPEALVSELMPKVEYEMSWTDGSLDTIRICEQQLLAQGKMKAPLDWNSYVYADLLKKVQPASVTITQLPPK